MMDETSSWTSAWLDYWPAYYDRVIEEWFTGQRKLVDELYSTPPAPAPRRRPLVEAVGKAVVVAAVILYPVIRVLAALLVALAPIAVVGMVIWWVVAFTVTGVVMANADGALAETCASPPEWWHREWVKACAGFHPSTAEEAVTR